MHIILNKLKELCISVCPIVVLVLVLNFTIAPLEPMLIGRFLLGAVLVIVGLTIFLLGVDLGITPLGDYTGSTLARSNKVWLVLCAGLILGFFISIAEPGLMVLAGQVNTVTKGLITGMSILLIVSVGLAILLSLGFVRIFYNFSLNKMLLILYGFIFVLAIFTPKEFFAIAFDASGATTGILAVPFILSLSVGISHLKKDSQANEEDSFGLVAIASAGAIIGVMILGIVSNISEFASDLTVDVTVYDSMISAFTSVLPDNLKEGVMAILPLLLIFVIMQRLFFKLRKREVRKLVTGFIFAFIGLVIFLTGVNAGFMEVGIEIGTKLATLENKAFIVVVAFVMGVVTILAEPAVYVLTHQIEDVTSGYVNRMAVLIPLAIGVGTAVMLSVVRILVKEIALWHYILPGYIIALGLMYFAPKLFVGIAFDAGGVATGPMTATFILAFTQGAASAFEGADLMVDGFGMIAMVAMMPIITLEILGVIFKHKSKAGEEDD